VSQSKLGLSIYKLPYCRYCGYLDRDKCHWCTTTNYCHNYCN